jgi:hypothetical protein
MARPGQKFIRGLSYGAAAGLFGGAVWFLMLTIVVPQQVRFSGIWWVLGAAGTAVWLAAGFVTGRFGPDARSREGGGPPGTKPSGAVEAAGRLLYRLVVGSFVGFIAAIGSGVLAGFLLALAVNIEKTLGSPQWVVALSAIFGCCCGGFSGGVSGALFAARPAVGRTAAVASLFGLGFGASVGAATVVGAFTFFGTESVRQVGARILLLPVTSGTLVGALSGPLARLAAGRPQRDRADGAGG